MSSSCESFLSSLNGNAQLSACSSSLLTAISAFTPASVGDSFTQTTAQVSAALDGLCSQDGCDETVVRAQLSQFYGNCSAELGAGSEVVIGQYDVLYVLVPMTAAICAQDSAGGWCVEDIVNGVFPAGSASTSAATSAAANATASASASYSNLNLGATSDAGVALSSASEPTVASASASATDATASLASSAAAASSSAVASIYATPSVSSLVSGKAYSISSYLGAATSPQALFEYAASVSTTAGRLLRRATSVLAARSAAEATGLIPVTSTWAGSNLPFMLLSSNMSSTLLCTACTSAIMAPYISWESRMPYPLGLSNSPMLGQQHVLWSGLGTTCGSGYLASITSKAGESSSVSSGAGQTWAAPAAGAALAGVVAVVALLV